MLNFYDLTMREQTLYENYVSKGYSDLQIALQLADERITNRILKSKGDWTKAKRREIQALIQEEISSSYGGLFESMQRESITSAQVVLGATIGKVSAELPKAVISDLMNSQREIRMSESAVYTFKDLFKLTEDNHVRQLKTLIASGIAQGQTAAQIVNEYTIKSELLTKGQIVGNIYTVISNSRDGGRYVAFKQLEDEGIIEGYIYDATLDSGTTVYCREHDQRVYNQPIEEIQKYIKVHARCRSIFRPKPILSQSETRASQVGEVASEPYSKWYDRQSDEFKQSTLTNRNYNKYLKGQYKVKGLADIDKPTDLNVVKKLIF